MAAPQGTIDIVATRILVESQEALQSLKNFDAGVNKTTTNLDKIAIKMTEIRRRTGQSIKEIVKEFQKINNPKGGGQFGSLGVNDTQIKKAGELVAMYEKMLGVQAKNTAEANKRAAAEKKVADQAARKVAQQNLPQNLIPSFVNKQFGDINSYIAQSSDKVAAWKKVVQSSAKAAGVSFEQAGTQLKKMVSGTTVAPLNTALKQLGDDGRSSFQKLIDGAHFARIALGALVSMLLFTAIQAVQQFVKTSITQFTELEESLFRISAAEKVLSEAGVEVSVSGLKKGITELRKELKIFSEEELTKLVGQLSVLTKELGFNEDQILALARAAAVKNLVSPEVETLDQTAGKLVTTLLTNQSKGAATLGIALSDADIEAKALQMNLLNAGEAASDLSDKEKDLVKLQIILDSAAGDSDKLAEFLETNSAKIKENSAAWEELEVAAGGFFSAAIPVFTPLLEFITDGINGIKAMIVFFDVLQASLRIFKEALTSSLDPRVILENVRTSIAAIPKIFDEVAGKEIPALFAKMPANAPDWFKDFFGEYLTDVETATNDTAKFKDELEDEDALKALEDIEEKIQDIILSAQQAQEDLDLKLEQKTEDLDTEYIRKGEDAARNHADKLEDINQDALDKIEDAKRKSREDEEKAERDLLQKLKELRQRFLMDLEDALHERDARQVLRLIREYKFDKQNILDKKKLEDQERKESLQADLEAIEIERQRRIESENIEYQRKLADLAQAKQREQEELALWYAREQEDIARNVQQKLEKLLAGYIAEGKIHEDQQAAIYATLVKYFGKDMALVDSLAQFMAQRFAQINAMAGSLGSGYRPLDLGSLGSHSTGRTDSRSGFAEGGSVIATKPTRAIFGERGAELATFTPLGRTGKDVNKLFGDVSSAGGASGMAKVLLSLSPDLEARILDDAMSGVALTIERVRREKR